MTHVERKFNLTRCKSASGLLLLMAAAVSSPAETYKVLYTFRGGSDGAFPAYGGLTVDAEGNLYGATPFGGNVNCPPSPSASKPGPGCGVVFKFNLATNTETVLYTFNGESDGSNPYDGLVRDAQGNLYGTAPFGGVNNGGVIYKVDSSGNLTVLHSFTNTDGANPSAKLYRDPAGNLFGTTVTGGSLGRCRGMGCGVIFVYSATGEFKVIHNFASLGNQDGANPSHALIGDGAGNLYGTTENGGLPSCLTYGFFEPILTEVGGCGTIFKLDSTGQEMSLHLFNAVPDGSSSRAPLIRDAAGNFYGTTFAGGLYGAGTVFKLDSTGKETILYNFRGSTDGANPWSGLVQDEAGNLYGTANHAGGPCYCGTVFKLDPQGNYTLLHTFDGSDGQYPGEPLLFYRGTLYGLASGGGTLNDGSPGTGVIFEVSTTK